MTQIYPNSDQDTPFTDNGSIIIPLINGILTDNYYTVHMVGNFGSGTITAFTNPLGSQVAKQSTTYDVAILDSTGTAISKTANAAFRFGCDSDVNTPTVLKLVLAGATSPNVIITVCNNK